MKNTFDDIAGYAREKEELQKLCEIINNRRSYLEKGAKLPKGIIFYGETGTGKTLFAKVLASACSLKVLTIDAKNFSDGRAISKQIRKAFAAAARSKEPAMIFFDEIDKVLPNAVDDYDTDTSRAILTQLLTSIDGMDSSGNFIFVATCNRYASLPESIVRSGRIDKKIHIGNPDYASRIDILQRYMGKTSCRFEIAPEELAKLTPGFSCAALETLVNECVLHSDENMFVSEQLIRYTILENKTEDIPRPSPTQADIANACRNIGCFVVSKNFDDGDYLLRLGDDTVCNLYFNGLIAEHDSDFDNEDGIDFGAVEDRDENDDDDEDDDDDCYDDEDEETGFYFTKSDYLHAICALMGGIAAEEIVLNKTYDNIGRLLYSADAVMTGMSYNGLLGSELRYSIPRAQNLPYMSQRIDAINAALDKIAFECMQTARNIVETNASLIKRLIPILVQKRSVFKTDCEEIVASLGGVVKVDVE